MRGRQPPRVRLELFVTEQRRRRGSGFLLEYWRPGVLHDQIMSPRSGRAASQLKFSAGSAPMALARSGTRPTHSSRRHTSPSNRRSGAARRSRLNSDRGSDCGPWLTNAISHDWQNSRGHGHWPRHDTRLNCLSCMQISGHGSHRSNNRARIALLLHLSSRLWRDHPSWAGGAKPPGRPVGIWKPSHAAIAAKNMINPRSSALFISAQTDPRLSR